MWPWLAHPGLEACPQEPGAAQQAPGASFCCLCPSHVSDWGFCGDGLALGRGLPHPHLPPSSLDGFTWTCSLLGQRLWLHWDCRCEVGQGGDARAQSEGETACRGVANGDSREDLVCLQFSGTSDHTGPLLRRQVPRVLRTRLKQSSSPNSQMPRSTDARVPALGTQGIL